jgi:hypothetical protein
MAKKSPYIHERLADDEILPDGGRRLVPLRLKDAAGRDTGEVVQVESWQRDTIWANRLGLGDGLDLHKPGQRFSTDRAANDAREEVYQDEKRKLQDAWRKPVADIANEARGAQEGDECTVREGGINEGAPGHLRMVKGALKCVPDKRRQDAVPPSMTADAAQKIRDEAWLEMCRDLESAWRKPAS